jgi:integrase
VRKSDRSPREYLTEREVERLMKAASDNRWSHRDATAILIAYRHGLRASELVVLRWDDIDLRANCTCVGPKGGAPDRGRSDLSGPISWAYAPTSTVTFKILSPSSFSLRATALGIQMMQATYNKIGKR